MANEKKLKAQLAAYLEGWSTNNKESWLALFADNATLEDPVSTPTHKGKEAIAAFWDRVHELPMRFIPEIQRAVICGNEGMLLFRMVTRSEGGPGMAVDIVDIITFNDEAKITSLKAYWDAGCSTMVE